MLETMDAFTLCESGSKDWLQGPSTDRPYKLFFRLEKKGDKFNAHLRAEFRNLNEKQVLDAGLGFDVFNPKSLRDELRELQPGICDAGDSIFDEGSPNVKFILPLRDLEVRHESCGPEGHVLSVFCFFRNSDVSEVEAKALALDFQRGKLDPAEWLDIL